MITRVWHEVVDGVRPQTETRAALYLLVGLGNPGSKYAHNRHNVGFQCIDYVAQQHAIAVERKRFDALVGEGTLAGRRVILAKPQTFMNASGEAVGPLSRWFKIPPQRVLVIYDDLDLPLGKVRLRPGGSSGGHHGIESVIADLSSTEFPRLRIGIGRPQQGDPIDYVLNDFDSEQTPTIHKVYPLVQEIVCCFLGQGVKAAMNAYNGIAV